MSKVEVIEGIGALFRQAIKPIERFTYHPNMEPRHPLRERLDQDQEYRYGWGEVVFAVVAGAVALKNIANPF